MITKPCPGCKAIIGRTLRACPNCGHAFVGKNTWREQKMAERGGPQKPGRKPKYDMDAPEADPELRLLDAVAPKAPLDDTFKPKPLPSGGILLEWPGLDVRFTLTVTERRALKAVI